MDDKSSQKRLGQLAALIAKGASFDAAVEALAPVREAQTVVFRRASFVRVFGREMFNALLAMPGISFEDFVRLPGVEHAATAEAHYRIRDAVAAEYLQDWVAKEPQAIRELSAAVYQHVAERPEHGELEALRFRVAAQPAEALEDFTRLFAAADQDFDLGRCHALVQMLRELDNFQVGRWSAPLRLLSPELRALCDEMTSYVAARGRFIEEYAKSASYLEREVLRTRTEQFLQPTSTDWLLPIYGAGGRGKTIFLQWLIARYCVPRGPRIPVAKVDFDDINVAKLGRFPFLLLLRFAEQLDSQIFGSPFSDLLRRHGKFASVLLPSARVPSGQSVEGLESELESAPGLEVELQQTFAMKLAGHTSLVILDTVEEGVLHFPQSLIAVFNTLRQVHQEGAQLKAIVAGRYDLAARNFLTASDPAPLEVTPFSDDEATRYLVDSRRLKPPDLVPAIAAKAGGNPFILSLIADLVDKGDVRTVAEVKELKPEYAYLIRRIIGRIPDTQFGVRWVVRYGVIPRRLTVDFLHQVMVPVLRDELAKMEGDLDKVKEFRESFPRGPIRFVTLWSELREYAAPNGWLRAADDDVRFQPEVVRPMRSLLAQEDIHDVLHEKARDWYEQRAAGESEPGRWADWMAESLYHRFWLLTLDAVDRWRSSLADRRAATGEVRRTLLEVVTGFAEGEGDEPPVIEPRVQKALPLATISWAMLEWAKSGAGLGFGPCRLEESAPNIRRKLRLARALSPPDQRSTVTVNLIEMALAIDERTYDRALALGLAISAKDASDEEGYSSALLMARALAGLRRESADSQYELAFNILRRQTSAAYPSFEVLAEGARELARIGKPDLASTAYSRAITSAGAQSEHLALEAAELQVEVGGYAEALRLVRAGEPTLERTRIRVMAWVAQGRLDRAVDAWERVLLLPNDAASAPACEMRGVIFAPFYELNEAVLDLGQALTSYRRAGEVRRAEGVMLRLLRVLKDDCGNWRQAEQLLAQGGPESPMISLERAHLETLQGGRPDPVADSPAGRLFSAIEREEDPRPVLRQFAKDIEGVVPISARYEQLRVFRFLLSPLDGVADLERSFLDAVPLPAPESPDFHAHVFDYVDLLRCLKSPLAEGLLQQAADHRLEGDYPLPRIIQAAARLGKGLPSVQRVEDFARAATGTSLAVATKVEFTAALIERGGRGDHDAARHFTALEIPPSLQGTEIEARHLKNRYLVFGGALERKALVEGGTHLLGALGQEASARRLVARGEARGTQVAIELRTLSDPWHESGERQTISFRHVKELAGPFAEAARALRAALPENAARKGVIELAMDDAPLVVLPWEWAFPTETICYRSSLLLLRFVRRLSPVRWIWPQLPGQLRRILSLIQPIRVLILKQPISHQERLQRGFDLVSRRPLSAIYKERGARSFEPQQLETAAIQATFAVQHPQVVHIQAPVIEEEGTLALDLPLIARERGRPQRFTADYLGGVLRAALRTRHAPLLILDPPRPPDDSEVARQLLLRNRFAADLVALGRARAVLCTGLVDPARMELAADRLADTVSLGSRLQEVLLLCREVGSDHFSGRGTALFAAKPSELIR